MQYRIEKDSMGEVKVPKDVYWGAQTQRSLDNFKIGSETMPEELICAYAIVKKAVAITNQKLKSLSNEKANLIAQVCDEILLGQWNDQFPLKVWQTGSGTQTNMNLNEVIANRAFALNPDIVIHPNDDVNRSQSSNDTFPTAMHISAVLSLKDSLLPSIRKLAETLLRLEEQNKNIVKIGRTHLQDATPITLGQEISGWRAMLEKNAAMLETAITYLSNIALGGTAVGTGLNTHSDYADQVAKEVSALTQHEFVSSENKFHALTSKDELVFAHGAMKALAANLMKIANDIRWLASGPRSGIGELRIPENEPGSSIMPGKINPTQCEALTMVAVQVMANDVAVAFSASQGNFELNVYMPVLIYNFLQSSQLLSNAIDSFRLHCVEGIKPNLSRIQENLNNSLMLVTALNNHIGYEKAAQIAQLAYSKGLSLKEAAIETKILSGDEFDNLVIPENMVSPRNTRD